ncbi:GATA zinc finger domain-containing protein 14 isoform X2 [Microplitis mediator]|nr:GATA zinc finger domain-containing protein 14 isoform X2 [Microplitis mediator]
MPPNAEEEILAVKPWSLQQEKERLRPPTYNAEDYATALRRWGRRPITNDHDSQGTLPSTTSSSSGYISGSGEMTLRQFTSVSELVNKLRADLRLAFPSFVQEFSSPPADGITLLLETLRGVQLVQSTPPSAGQSGPRVGTRRAALDELGCVECLAACVDRCADAPRLLSQAQPGLVALAVCLTSSLNRSRVLALQLLTKVCQIPGGHTAVSEAVSTLRLRYGEGGRFRFLAGALLAPRAAVALRVAGISFLNAFLKSAPSTQSRLYIQAEACEAGLEPRALQQWLSKDEIHHSDELLGNLLKKQVYKWSQNCIDVDNLQKRLVRAEETCTILTNKITVLQNQLEKLQMKKRTIINYDDGDDDDDDDNINSEKNFKSHSLDIEELKRVSSNGKDEGISSSERSSSPENLHHHHHHHHHYRRYNNNNNNNNDNDDNNQQLQQQKLTTDKTIIDNDQETTIDDVIEELRIIVKDAEEEEVRKDAEKITIDNNDTKVDGKCLKIVVQGPEVEEAIVPAILYPQPPRKIPQCLSTIITSDNAPNDEFLGNISIGYNNDNDQVKKDIFCDESDSLLSASRLKYINNNNNDNNDENNCGLYLNKRGVTIREESESKLVTNNNNNEILNNVDDTDDDNNLTEPCKYFETRQFESHLNNNNNNNHHHNQRYIKSQIEKKLLRRSASQNCLDKSITKSSTTRIEDRIKKFESMNLFDTSLKTNNNLPSSRNNLSSRRIDDGNYKKIRRSESCHQVLSYFVPKEINNNNNHKNRVVGSENRLDYVDNYYDNNMILMHQTLSRRFKPYKIVIPPVSDSLSNIKKNSPNSKLTKSLDRIDEGLNSLVDIVIGGNGSKKHKSVSAIQNVGKSLHLRINNDNNKNENLNRSHDKELAVKSNNRLSKKINGSSSSSSSSSLSSSSSSSLSSKSSSILRNDKELYSKEITNPKNLANKYHFNNFGRALNLNNDNFKNDSSIISSYAYKKSSDKFFVNDSIIFSTSGNKSNGGAFGLNQNRFNAGKYSGNHNAIKLSDNIQSRKNSVPSIVNNRCKVTDIISGLY